MLIDIVVVGSGAGGAAVAGELLRAGRRVVLVEAGPARFGARGQHARNLDSSEAGMPAFGRRIVEHWTLPCGSPSPIRGLEGMLASHGFGGMFALWASNSPTPHAAELPEWLPLQHWEPYLDRARRLLHVSQTVFGRGVRSARLLERVRALFDGKRIGRPVQHMPIAAAETPNGLKYAGSDDLLAGDYGSDRLTILSGHIVRRVLTEGPRATGVVAWPAAGGDPVTIHAEVVVLAGSTLPTAQLAFASGIETGPALGRFLLDHPLISTRVLLKPEILENVPENDPIFSIWIPFSPENPFQSEVFRYPQEPPVGMRDQDGADVATFVSQDINPDNRLRFDTGKVDDFGLPGVSVDFVHSDADTRRIAAAAAENYLVSSAVADTRQGWVPVLYKAGGSAHLMGSCRMGAKDDGTSVVDRHGRFWRMDNLYAAGNAVLGVSSAANPSLTTVAAALMTADHILGRD